MPYLLLYLIVIFLIWWVYNVGWKKGLKQILNISIPSAIIILFNVTAGRLLFKNPLLGVISILPTTIFFYKASLPFLKAINSWIDKNTEGLRDSQTVVEAEVISKEDIL